MAVGDVEISTLVPQGEWTDESLAVLVEGYGRKLTEMGALPDEIKAHVEHTSRGGVKIRVVWEKGDAAPQSAAPQSGAAPQSAAAPRSGGVDAQHGEESPAG